MTVLFIAVIVYYRKYSETKRILDYEVNDVRNIARPSAEMMEMDKKVNKYSTLTTDTSNI